MVWALPPGACGLAETARVARWYADQGAGQCGPCTHGLPAIADAFEAVVAGRGPVVHLQRYAALVMGRGACHHPDGAAALVTSAIEVFWDEIERHATHGPCPASWAQALPVPSGGGWR